MTIGFTGTRQGMTPAQRSQLKTVLRWLVSSTLSTHGGVPPDFHHGDSPHGGADQQAADVALLYGCTEVKHPPFYAADADQPTRAKAMLSRNRDIVERCDVLIAAPATDAEVLRAGTWATIRYARSARKPVIQLSRGVK